jgi:hypothetical protein
MEWWLAYLFILARFSLTGLICFVVWRYYERAQKEELRRQFEAEQQAALQTGMLRSLREATSIRVWARGPAGRTRAIWSS